MLHEPKYVSIFVSQCNYAIIQNLRIMNRIVLKSEIVDKIKNDSKLLKKVAAALGISDKSMPRLLYGNDRKLTTAGVLKVLREYLGISNDKELLSEIQMKAVA